MRTGRVLAPVIGVMVFLGAWEAFVRVFDVRKFVLRAPSTAVHRLWTGRADFLPAAWTTVQHSLIGLGVALALAVVVGAGLSTSRFLEQATQPVLTLVQVTPWFAYAGSVVVWLKSGTPPTLFLISLVCFPAYVFATIDGMRSVEPSTLELLASVDASRWETMRRLRLPAAAPGLFTTSRFNFGLSLAAAYYMEGANFSNEGLGSIGKRSAARPSTTDTMWAAVFAVALIGIGGLLLLTRLQRTVLHWHAAQRSQPS
ncbi:MAG: ABC transporter permease subunit [Ilumatobacteraceae bacterium]